MSKNRGEYVDSASAEVTIATPGKEWLRRREGVLKSSSMRPLQSAWSKHVEPKWGARKVGGIRHSEVQAWVSTIAGHDAATARKKRGPKAPRSQCFLCAPDWNRTSDLWYRKPTLYPLSYGGVPIESITA